ncbi:MAG: protoporphyrinogen oxidase HemJ [Legionellaceae bacterium]|nr:protoporphyrinogen oxidase HemJ [Legionellaceae bacterium]
MLIIKSFHIIAMVAWFAGLFYLPRLFVYHADAVDRISIDRFKVMEYRLFYAITTPAAVLTTVLGIWLMSYNSSYYLNVSWMHAKLGLVVLLWIYHVLCGFFVKQFDRECSRRTSKFYRLFNEVPTLLLIGIVILVVIKP